MGTITYSFETGYQGWAFSDDSTDANATTSRTHDAVNECISNRLVDPGPVNPGPERAIATNYIDTSIPFQIGDSVDFDYSISSDGKTCTKRIEIFYTDDTSELTSLSSIAAGTITVTATVAKTVERIEAAIIRGCGAGVCPVDMTVCAEEIRINTAAAVTATPGKLRTPQAVIDEQSDGGGGVPGGDGGGSGGNLASVSADNQNVYIASFNDLGFPTLIKISAALSADGSVVFNPGAGGRIGVQCGKQNADHLWIAGQFDSTNTIEKSEDDGSSFTVKDDGSFGAIRTFEIGPNDTEVLIFDGDNGDIIETLDDGATWTSTNVVVVPLINSITRYGQNPEEIVAGNQGDATNSINYSPNTGANLEDYQTGVYPNADATKVIAN